jgi:hypothetical protein
MLKNQTQQEERRKLVIEYRDPGLGAFHICNYYHYIPDEENKPSTVITANTQPSL